MTPDHDRTVDRGTHSRRASCVSTGARCSARCRSRCGASSSRRTSATASGSRCAACCSSARGGHPRRRRDRRQACAQARRHLRRGPRGAHARTLARCTRTRRRRHHRRRSDPSSLRPCRRLDATRWRSARAALPAARYYVQRRNWDNALAPNPRERASYQREDFVPLEEAGVVTWWEGAGAVARRRIFTADGHHARPASQCASRARGRSCISSPI